MTHPHSKSQPQWTDVKKKLATFDRQGLLGLIQDLYNAEKDNRTFLHARFDLGDNVLKLYKEVIDRWTWPDVLRNQNYSVSKAKKAISDYKKAVGDPAGLAELWVFYCERAVRFSQDISLDDAAYYDALVHAFQRAVVVVDSLPEEFRQPLIDRLDVVCETGQNIGYGVGVSMELALAQLL